MPRRPLRRSVVPAVPAPSCVDPEICEEFKLLLSNDLADQLVRALASRL